MNDVRLKSPAMALVAELGRSGRATLGDNAAFSP